MNNISDSVAAEVLEALAIIKKIYNPPMDAVLKEDLGIDSIQLVRIITRLTLKLKVDIFKFSDQDLANLRTVRDLITLLEQ